MVGCPLSPEALRALDGLEWRGVRGGVRALKPTRVRAAADRLLVTFEGVGTREAAARLTNGLLWAPPEQLPDPGPGVSYAFQLVGMRVVDPGGRELGVVEDVVWNVGQPLLQLAGPGARLLPAQPPFMRHVDVAGRVITLDLPAGFEEF